MPITDSSVKAGVLFGLFLGPPQKIFRLCPRPLGCRIASRHRACDLRFLSRIATHNPLTLLRHVDDVIKDQEVILVELGEGAFKGEFTTYDLQTVHEIAGAHEHTRHPFSTSASPMAAAKWLLPAAGRPNNPKNASSFAWQHFLRS
jgi:hypothetical protein